MRKPCNFVQWLHTGRSDDYRLCDANLVALADALQRLIEDKQLHTMMGKSGQQRVIQDFNIRKNADQLAALFERCLS